MSETVLVPNATELSTRSNELLDLSKAIVINSPEELQAVVEFIQDVKQFKDMVHEKTDPVREATHKAWKAAVSLQNDLLTPLNLAEENAKKISKEYIDAEDRRRQEANRALVEKAEAAERARREAEEAENRRQAEAERAAALQASKAAKKAGDEKAAAAAKAEAARIKADADRRAAELAAAPIIVAVEAPAPIQKTAGMSSTKVYGFEITNLERIPRAYMIPDEKKIQAVVKQLKEHAAAQIPGIKVTVSTQVNVRKS